MITDEMVEAAALAMLNAKRREHYLNPIETLDDAAEAGPWLAEARAALEAVAPMIAAQAREAALEEAGKALDKIAERHWKPVQVFRSDAEVEHDDIRHDTTTENARAVRALKEYA